MSDVVAALDKDELFVWLDPWSYRTKLRGPYWRLCQTAAVAAAVCGLGLSRAEIEAALRRRNRDPEEADGPRPRGEYTPGREAVLDVLGARARTMPVIPAVAAVFDRAIRTNPWTEAETLFTDDVGGPLDVRSAMDTIRRCGVRAGEPELLARLRATFRDTLDAHPVDDGTVEALTGRRRDRLADPREAAPEPHRLRAAMMCHPLAPYGTRIQFFEKGRPASPLLDQILALKETRLVAKKDRDTLLLRHFPEVHRLWRDFAFDAAQAARYFGIKTSLFIQWARRFETHGREGLRDMRPGLMTLEMRTLVLTEYDETKFECWRRFHEHLVALGFPYTREPVEALLHAEGFEPPTRWRLDAEWRPKVLAAWDAAPPRSYQSLHVRLKAEGFPYQRVAMQGFLESEGRSVRFRDFLDDPWRAKALAAARKEQPIANVADFHRRMKPPMTRRVFRDFLIRGGIEVARRVPKPAKPAARHRASRAGDEAGRAAADGVTAPTRPA
jgi:transposase